MLELLWLIPALPFAGFAILALGGGRLPRPAVAAVGVGSVGLSAATSALLAYRFFASPPAGGAYEQVLWQWMRVGEFRPSVSLYLDPLAVVMVLVVTGVGFLIHLYSAEFMEEESGYSRFFAYMNLFAGSMLVLVLAGDLLLLYLGWEGVGLCSYLLIGFWYRDPANGWAARKAFVVTRVGDTAMAIGLFLLFTRLGTLEIQEVLSRAPQEWAVGSGIAVAAAALLLGGAVGKSAQLPLQTWLPDAMAGPTPVSALIHAATMVTAGVYLIARTHALFTLAPEVLTAVAVIGAATLLLAGASALTQRDLKRVLAYSTISQIGYMFLALGVGAWSAAVFHLMTHAFFKALLFLGAGAISVAIHHQYDLAKMGGLRRELPLTFWTFLAAGASLAGLPVVTAGFYSKDLILWQAWSSERGGAGLWAAALAGALLTSLYIFRAIFLAFFGEARTEVGVRPGRRIEIPLAVLAVLSVVGGLVEVPGTLGGFHGFSGFLEGVLPPATGEAHGTLGQELALQGAAATASLAGIVLAYLWFLRRPRPAGGVAALPGLPSRAQRFLSEGWAFDRLYNALFARPFVGLAVANRGDFLDLIYRRLAWSVRKGHEGLVRTQTGRLRWYAAGLAAGAVLVVALVMLL